MSQLTAIPPTSPAESIVDVLHGISVADPYRWLEQQDSARTRKWIEEQYQYARSYLDHISGRDRIRERVRQFLAIETHDCFLKAGSRYFFRKRLPNQEQPCIYMREGINGTDHLLIDPSTRGTGDHTAVKPILASSDGKLLLFEIKEGGERSGTFTLFDVDENKILPDVLPRGYLRGFAFSPDRKGFYYVHEPLDAARPFYRAAYHHELGSGFNSDREIFFAADDPKVRLCLTADQSALCFVTYRFGQKVLTSIYTKPLEGQRVECVLADAEFSISPALVRGQILAVTDRDAPNLRVVRLTRSETQEWKWTEVVPENNSRIHEWIVAGDCMLVSYIHEGSTQVSAFDLDGRKISDWPVRPGERTIHFVAASSDDNQVVLESESFARPAATLLCHARTNKFELWVKPKVPFDPDIVCHKQVRYTSKDGTRVPMFLVGRRDVLTRGCHPAIMTSYGGYGLPVTAQFSVFVALLIERGCLFALPGIRGGADLGARWHEAAKSRNRQNAYDDFLSAAEWLIARGHTTPEKLAIFGGSNSGLLVGVALTQRPDLFRAVVCIAPMLDMLRYHLFDNAHVWRDEFGTSESAEDFNVLNRYSPYHQVQDDTAYPATLIISGDADKNCNPLHARKMTARLQTANSSNHPIILDYSPFRGHSPVLPLSERIEALTDRLAFLSEQLQLPV